MKKSTKSKTKKPAKKMAKAKKATKTVKAKSKVKAKAKAKKPAGKSKGLSIAQLYEMKKKKEQAMQEGQSYDHVPPHELHDKVDMHAKEKGNGKMVRGPGPGSRHH